MQFSRCCSSQWHGKKIFSPKIGGKVGVFFLKILLLLLLKMDFKKNGSYFAQKRPKMEQKLVFSFSKYY
jgi:hypothetical protein